MERHRLNRFCKRLPLEEAIVFNRFCKGVPFHDDGVFSGGFSGGSRIRCQIDFGGGFGRGFLILAVDVRIRCQIRCRMNFGGGSSFLALDLSIWRWIWQWIFLLAVDLAVDVPFSGGSKNPLPKFGGEGPLGCLLDGFPRPVAQNLSAGRVPKARRPKPVRWTGS